MEYYLSNPEIDSKIKEIKIKIRLSMNGVVSDQMINSGIIYKKNFGVSIPRLKELAKDYTQNHDLAQRLWSLGIRETMILATLIEPAEKFTYELAQQWVKDFNQIEIIEQSTMNLFSKLSFSNRLAVEWVQSENYWEQITGFILSARAFGNFDKNTVVKIIEKGLDLSKTDNLHLYKSIALCLSRFCRIDKETAMLIQTKTEILSNSPIHSQQFIFNEVKQEILFLDIL